MKKNNLFYDLGAHAKGDDTGMLLIPYVSSFATQASGFSLPFFYRIERVRNIGTSVMGHNL